MKKTILFLLVTVTMVMVACYTPHRSVRHTHHGHNDGHYRTGHH